MTRSVARRFFVAAWIALLAGAVAAPALEAQAVPTGATPIRYYRGVIGLNPLGIPFDIFAIEGEGAIAPGITLAGAGSYVGPGDDQDDRFTSGDVKLRYYPGETALEGFAVGLAAGITQRSGVNYAECVVLPNGGCDYQRNKVSGPTISVLADYNFLLGQRRRFFVGTGIGAKRWLVDRDTRDRVDAQRAWVFGRFLVGLAF